MTYIVQAGSTMYPAKFCIINKGYKIGQNDCKSDTSFVTANKDGSPTFEADDYESLLGLIVMYEMRGEFWSTWSAEEIAAYRG